MFQTPPPPPVRLAKIWDYQNKSCVQTLDGHAQNVSAVSFHPELPIILTGSEDGKRHTHTLACSRVWNGVVVLSGLLIRMQLF